MTHEAKKALGLFEEYWFKPSITVLIGMVGWFSLQVYGTLKEISVQFNAMDKRVAVMESSKMVESNRIDRTEALSQQTAAATTSLQAAVLDIQTRLNRNKIY